MCAEKCITKYVKGFPRREWVKLRHRNEALDCEVYAIAALTLLNININQLADRLDRQPKGPTKDAAARKRGIISRGIE
jgi:phage terminase large subunit GpA-like protein